MATRAWLALMAVMLAIPTALLWQVKDAVDNQTNAINKQGCATHLLDELIGTAPTGPQTPPSEAVIIARIKAFDSTNIACRGQ